MQEYYKILNVSENATDEEIDNAYKTLKEKYQRERFLEGEEGNLAAKNLTKLENAYEIIKSSRVKTNQDGEKKIDFSEVEKNIRDGNLSKAQEVLDEINNRDAEWHYLQSVIFYKKNWMNDSKRQLEIAINLDPQNTKYADAYSKLKQKIEFTEQKFNSGNYQNAGNNYYNSGDPNHNNQHRQMGGGSECLNFCMTWCCMEMLCSVCCR